MLPTLTLRGSLVASIVTAAMDVVLATQDQLPARIAVLEAALQKNEKAARLIAKYDGPVISLIVAAITD